MKHTRSTLWARKNVSFNIRKVHICWNLSNKSSRFSINIETKKAKKYIQFSQFKTIFAIGDKKRKSFLFWKSYSPRSCIDCTHSSSCCLKSRLCGDFNMMDRANKSFSISAKCISRPEWEENTKSCEQKSVCFYKFFQTTEQNTARQHFHSAHVPKGIMALQWFPPVCQIWATSKRERCCVSANNELNKPELAKIFQNKKASRATFMREVAQQHHAIIQ